MAILPMVLHARGKREKPNAPFQRRPDGYLTHRRLHFGTTPPAKTAQILHRFHRQDQPQSNTTPTKTQLWPSAANGLLGVARLNMLVSISD
jgi:hypothetical protein